MKFQLHLADETFTTSSDDYYLDEKKFRACKTERERILALELKSATQR